MKIFFGVMFAGILCLAVSQPAFAQWYDEHIEIKRYSFADAKKMPLISVRGTAFVNQRGDTVLFRGVAIADPDKVEGEGHWSKAFFGKVGEMGATIVRIPVHPLGWRNRGPEKYLALLDQAIEWCTELNMYIMIDWHSIGNLKTGLFQDKAYVTTLTETQTFWRVIAERYAGVNTVAFYELFNEPTTDNNRLGPVSWHEWKKINEDLIAMIRAYDTEKIPLVAPFDWAYDLTPLHLEPLDVQGIGYVTHPYAHKRPQPWEPRWDEDFGFAASHYPVFATEFGIFFDEKNPAAAVDYADRIIPYLEGKGISWTAWIFDPDWTPSLISSWETYKLTDSGEIFKKAMQRK